MLKKILPVLVGASLAISLAGCTDPIPAEQETLAEYPQVHVDSYSLQNDIVVQPPIPSRVGAGQLRVDIPIRNKTDSDLNLDYKYYFTDKNGVQVEHDTSWQAIRIPRKGIDQIEFTSLTPAPADFRVELRRRKLVD
jgi:uncharacterized protein YcfL